MTAKARVQARHRGATSIKGDLDWHIQTAQGVLLGSGSSAGTAWWNAYQAMREQSADAATGAPVSPSWPFPVSAHEERA